MTVGVQTGLEGVTIESVEKLYAEYRRMDVPDYYEEGQENPFAGRCRVVPRKATYYAMVPAKDETRLAQARLLLKGVARRRKVREVICNKGEINYNQFAPASKVVVLYV